MDPVRIKTIQNCPLPNTKKQLRGFLGLIGFCCPWLPSCGELSKPLHRLTANPAPDPLQWSPDTIQAFQLLKDSVASSMSLRPPNYSKPFHLFVHERGGIASGVLTQLSRPHHFPLAFYSQQIDPVAQGTPSCTRTLAAAALLITKAKSLILGHFTTVWTSHDLSALLRRGTTQVFSAHRQQQLEAELLEDTNLIFERCGPLNPATLLPDLPVLQDQHDCVEVVYSILQIRDNLFDVPLDNPDCILFSDGSSFYVDGKRFTGYAVTSERDIQEAASLPGNWGAQAAELYALARACQLAAGSPPYPLESLAVFPDRAAGRTDPPVPTRGLRLGQKVHSWRHPPAEVYWTPPGSFNNPDCSVPGRTQILDPPLPRQASRSGPQ
ncbi:uncharacterized protein LOC135983521 [Chrysemys picta bellii]|uniref:uncharacterized protein LOC135983521 n=1 Tax=Chrysemys picta bellii TaxID=8478 RepID=UPI0032B1167D